GFIDIVLIVAFAALTRLEYPTGVGSAVPAQLVIVPMLFLMPLRLFPLAVSVASLLSLGFTLAQRRRPNLCPNALGACWFALPPVLLLLWDGEKPFSWSHWPFYVLVFASLSLTDLTQTALYERFVGGVAFRRLVFVLVTVYAFDALLTPIAMLAASVGGYSFLALLPFTGVLYLLGHERRGRLTAQSEATRLEKLAHIDELTRVANRRSFERRLAVEQARARRSGSGLNVCLLDLDRFKNYNDTYGHQAGDDLLRRVAAAWTEVLRPEALLARIGGEEFALILPDTASASAEGVAARLRAATPREITFSIGIACWNGEETIADLIGRADTALYQAKSEGRDRAVLSP
ncbi:MAG TPA: GGDEF domain-containing protein, partial [Gaiellaceae bacterium]|nr:GGDEF domain-containing protein [Gaiellaceae bacterium]